MKKRTIGFIAIVSLVVVAAIGTGILLHSKTKKSVSESHPEQASQEDPQAEKQSTDRFHLSPEQLENMTDEELLQAVIDYPYLIDIFSTDHPEDAVPSLKENCAALKELIARGTAVVPTWPNTRKSLQLKRRSFEIN